MIADFLTYYRLVFVRALRDTLGMMEAKWSSALTGALALAFILAASWYRRGPAGFSRSLDDWLWSTALGIAGAAGLLFVLFLFAAPHRLHGEGLEALAACHKALADNALESVGITIGISGEYTYLPVGRPPNDPVAVYCIEVSLANRGDRAVSLTPTLRCRPDTVDAKWMVYNLDEAKEWPIPILPLAPLVRLGNPIHVDSYTTVRGVLVFTTEKQFRDGFVGLPLDHGPFRPAVPQMVYQQPAGVVFNLHFRDTLSELVTSRNI